MSCILHIETSTDVCSVALSQDGLCIDERVETNGPSHAQVLPAFVEEMISFADNHAIPLDAVAVSSGPGSYTGLRIGTSTAKGICYGRNIPLIAIPTLKILSTPVLLFEEDMPDDALLCPMLDARRMEVYTAVYDRALNCHEEVKALVVEPESFSELLEKKHVYFFGNGAEKCKEVIKRPHAHFIDDIRPIARNMYPLAERAFMRKQFVDTAYFEPFYLKEFVAGVQKTLLTTQQS